MFEALVSCLPLAVFGRFAQTVSLIQQSRIGIVIPDLLLGLWPASRPVVARQRSSGVESHIIALLEREQSLSDAQIMRRLHLTEEINRRSLKTLLRRGAIVECSTQRYELADHARTADIELVAVEVKLRRWRDALYQAKTYLAFANHAFVVLDGNQVNATPTLIEAFREATVGLFLQRGDTLALAVEAGRNRPVSSTRVRAVDALFGLRSQPGTVRSREDDVKIPRNLAIS